jgi:ketosteroid isomerase-like protein
MPTQKHLDAYLDAMHRRDVAGTMNHMADNVVIHSPIAPAPFEAKQQAVELLRALLTNVDSFDMKRLIGGDQDYVAVFTFVVGPHKVDGMDLSPACRSRAYRNVRRRAVRGD